MPTNITYTTVVSDTDRVAVCITPCPFSVTTPKYNIHIMVGGVACMNCKHFLSKDAERKEVTCEHP